MKKLGSRTKMGLAGVIVSASITSVIVMTNSPKSTHVDFRPDNIRVWVGAGHGGIEDGKYQTSGKQSPTWADSSKIYEGEICRKLAIMLTLRLMEGGYEVTFINAFQRDMSLQERVGLINGGKPDLFIDLHLNAQDCKNGDYVDFEGMRGYTSVAAGGATGMESFTSVGWTESDNFNENYLIPELRRAMPDIRWRGGKNGNLGKEAGFYMLRNTNCPAVLIEWNFMTTYDPDAKIILDPARQRTYVDAIYNSIDRYNEDRKAD